MAPLSIPILTNVISSKNSTLQRKMRFHMQRHINTIISLKKKANNLMAVSMHPTGHKVFYAIYS